MCSVHSELVSVAVEMVIGPGGATPRLLSSGRTSQAWVVDTPHGQWVARVPVENSGRTLSFESEALIAQHLVASGCPVAEWTVVTVDGAVCSVGRLLPGRPVDYEARWPVHFASSIASVLHELHRLPVVGFGPLENTNAELRGRSANLNDGIVDRWYHAAIWPFDQSGIDDHPARRISPALVDQVAEHRDAIVGAAQGCTGLVHSDLHREHLLVDEDWRLGGLLDFGDAFIGCTAWDFALLLWYYGNTNAQLVADNYPGGNDLVDRGATLAIAVGLYKIAKNPRDTNAVPRLARILETTPPPR
jgi:aminoglycoside phosphotransferase (APT) family kinase protein